MVGNTSDRRAQRPFTAYLSHGGELKDSDTANSNPTVAAG